MQTNRRFYLIFYLRKSSFAKGRLVRTSIHPSVRRAEHCLHWAKNGLPVGAELTNLFCLADASILDGGLQNLLLTFSSGLFVPTPANKLEHELILLQHSKRSSNLIRWNPARHSSIV